MYTSVLFIYSLQIFGYDSLWYNCSIVIFFFLFFFFFVLFSLFYSFVCSSHLCILSYMHVPYGAFFINKEFEFEFESIVFSTTHRLQLCRCLFRTLSPSVQIRSLPITFFKGALSAKS